jgi:hypothetical protein
MGTYSIETASINLHPYNQAKLGHLFDEKQKFYKSYNLIT